MEGKGVQFGKEEAKLFLDYMIIYVKHSKITDKKNQLEVIIDNCEVAGYKMKVQKSADFLYTNNEQVEFEVTNTLSFTIVTKDEILRCKFNKIYTRSI